MNNQININMPVPAVTNSYYMKGCPMCYLLVDVCSSTRGHMAQNQARVSKPHHLKHQLFLQGT